MSASRWAHEPILSEIEPIFLENTNIYTVSLGPHSMKRVIFLVLLMVLFPLNNVQFEQLDATSVESRTSHSTVVPQFGVAFEETIIADATDNLDTPRDLEFHPGANRSDELWVVNRATDSVTIIHETGTSSQWSDLRLDAYRNHFMEEVSAIAFGAYDDEFDYQFGTAQESRNTYNGQANPNNFMGPALWPSSLTHFTVEHQSDGLLGSHIDMLHESPLGMGIAHDNANAYWYFDGYYGDLVYYDFQEDHDTGMDNHSDGIVRRYSDIQLTRSGFIPGHMILDKDTGILYIADTGAGRVLWVNTDDPTTSSTNIMSSNTRLEPLQEYSQVTGMEWGVFATGMSLPSGIAMDGDTLFVSTNGNGEIRAYDIGSDGKTATLLDTASTNAVSIMGLEIGPNGALYYVDSNRDRVVRLDPLADTDGDGLADVSDNCPNTPNAGQDNLDQDSLGDACDSDDDNDSVADISDACPLGLTDWTSNPTTDHDGDGCDDIDEDYDDDNDQILDFRDDCPKGAIDWTSTASSDYDGDGCQDIVEDDDDDEDTVADVLDTCPNSRLGFISDTGSDLDGDGCEDSLEDDDDDGDGHLDEVDACPTIPGTSSQGDLFGCIDGDGDGWANLIDVFVADGTQWSDLDEDGYGDNPDGFDADDCVSVAGTSVEDRLGCRDTDGDGWSDEGEPFANDATQWLDRDGDGYGDNAQGQQADDCPDIAGSSSQDLLGCVDSDGDGWSDEADVFPNDVLQWSDLDNDGFGDQPSPTNGDDCPDIRGTSTLGALGCKDNDGDSWANDHDTWPDDATMWSDGDGDGFADQLNTSLSDDCPLEAGTSTEDRLGCIDTDGDGVSDQNDDYPTDASRSVHEPFYQTVWFIVLTLAVLTGAIVLFVRKKDGESDLAAMVKQSDDLFSNGFGNEPMLSPETMALPTTANVPSPLPSPASDAAPSQPVVQPQTAPVSVTPAGAPLPPEGLPP